jgi:hypothetical protein
VFELLTGAEFLYNCLRWMVDINNIILDGKNGKANPAFQM